MGLFKIKRSFLLACLLGLSACSFKPDSADIERELAEVYQCPILELSDVKKVDGAEVSDKLYDVAFTYTASIKGGKAAATNLFAEWYSLGKQLQLAERDQTRAIMAGNTQKEEQIGAVKTQLSARINTLMPCRTMEADGRLRIMYTEFAIAAGSGQDKIAVSLGAKISGVGRMGKAESGWRFAGMPKLTMTDFVTGEPAPYPKFKPLIAEEPQPTEAENDAPPSQLSPIDATPSR